MESLATYAIVATTTLVTIVDPVGLLAPFLAMTSGGSASRRPAVALRACLVGGGMLVAFALTGSMLFRVFGITLPAFRIAGGILLFLVALDMLRARSPATKTTEEERLEAQSRDDVAIFPLAIPLISGPGAIVSVVMLADRAVTETRHLVLHLAIAVTVITTYTLLRIAGRLAGLLGTTGMNVVTRLMGMLLAAMAMQFVVDGLATAFPALTVH